MADAAVNVLSAVTESLGNVKDGVEVTMDARPMKDRMKKHRRLRIFFTSLLTAFILLDIVTDWVVTGQVISKYRDLTYDEAYQISAVADGIGGCVRFAAEEQEVEDLRVYMTKLSTAQIVFTSVSTIIATIAILVHWREVFSEIPDQSREANDAEMSGSYSVNSERPVVSSGIQGIKKAFTPSPFIPEHFAVLFTFLTVLLEDFPESVLNSIVVNRTCEETTPFITISAIGAIMSSARVLWVFGLHFAYTIGPINWVMSFSENVFMYESGKPDNWGWFGKKLWLYPLIVILSVLVILVKVEMACLYAFGLVIVLPFALPWFCCLYCVCPTFCGQECVDPIDKRVKNFVRQQYLIFWNHPRTAIICVVVALATATLIININILLAQPSGVVFLG